MFNVFVPDIIFVFFLQMERLLRFRRHDLKTFWCNSLEKDRSAGQEILATFVSRNPRKLRQFAKKLLDEERLQYLTLDLTFRYGRTLSLSKYHQNAAKTIHVLLICGRWNAEAYT